MDEENLLVEARQHVQAQIEVLYSTFARYPHNPHVDACPYCVHGEDHQRLHRVALRKLQSDDVSKYAWKAMTTWGNANDFRHFLPRLFEVQTYTSIINTEVLFGKLRYGQWRTWPADEQQAIETYFDALWRYTLLLPSDEYLLGEEGLCAIAQAIDNLTPYLRVWESLFTSNALDRLAAFLEYSVPTTNTRGMLANPWWKKRPEQMQQVVAWLLNPQTRMAFDEHFDIAVDAPYVDALAVVIDDLQYVSFMRMQ